MIQSRKSTLTSFKLDHGWYSRFHEEIREPSLAVYRALYATDPATVNELHGRHGVTHLVTGQTFYAQRLRSRWFRTRYHRIVDEGIVGERTRFLLADLPREAVLYTDGSYTVLDLPLPPISIERAPGDPLADGPR